MIDSHAAIINSGIAHLDRTVLSQIDILHQLYFQLTVYIIDADVIVCQQRIALCILSCSPADDIQLVVKFLGNDLFFCRFRFALSIIAGVLHTIAKSGDELDRPL